jgi:hypothetical protein
MAWILVEFLLQVVLLDLYGAHLQPSLDEPGIRIERGQTLHRSVPRRPLEA